MTSDTEPDDGEAGAKEPEPTISYPLYTDDPQIRRYWPHVLPDNLSHSDLSPLTLQYYIKQYCQCIREALPPYPRDMIHARKGRLKEIVRRDPTPYTGTSGVAFMFHRLSQSMLFQAAEKKEFSTLAQDYIREALEWVSSSDPKKIDPELQASFLCGHAGIHAIASQIFMDTEDGDMAIVDLMNMSKSHLLKDFQQDGLMYGRAGYVWACLFVNILTDRDAIPRKYIDDVISLLLSSGVAGGEILRAPLLYTYYGRYYLGALNGLMGILYVLLADETTVQNPKNKILMKRALDWILDSESDRWRSPTPSARPASRGSSTTPSVSGPPGRPSRMRQETPDPLDVIRAKGPLKKFNMPSVANEPNAPKGLMQWCQGVTAAVFLFGNAYEALSDVQISDDEEKVVKDTEYLEVAIRAAEAVWERGLVKKGPGLCHGIAGNGYAMLYMYKLTKEDVWLARAQRFAEFMLAPDAPLFSKPSTHPYSLFEGLAGVVCFLADLSNPLQAKFPLFELPNPKPKKKVVVINYGNDAKAAKKK